MTEETQPNSVGELLKRGRLRQRLSIVDCAKRTHISSHYLEALESGHWEELPSESHRLGFLKAYSRFLGTPTDEMLLLYQKSKTAEKPHEAAKPGAKAIKGARTSWFSGSWEQLMGFVILFLIASWGIYHLVKGNDGSEPHINLWTRPRAHQTRLLAPTPISTSQKINIHADNDSWLRVSEGHHLLFEGILPKGSNKKWEGEGPFTIRLADIHAVKVFWNDQLVDLPIKAQNGLFNLRLPLDKGSDAVSNPSNH